MNDPYKTLGVPRDAPQDAVKHAYRRLAMELHPDRNPEDSRVAERFKDVNAAYSIIGDPLKRGRFDRGDIDAWGRRRPRPQRARSRTSQKPPPGQAEAKSKATGKSGESADGPDRAENVRSTNGPARDEAKPERTERRPRKEQQPKPTRPRNAATPNKQPRWLGGGIKAEDLFGPLFPTKTSKVQTNEATDPKHRLRVTFLEAVRGTTRHLTVGRGRTLQITVPPGIRDGQVIRLKGQGESGPLGARGDAMVTIEVTPHRLFRTEGDDVHLDVPVTLEEAVLGARIKVPTIDGSVEVTVPPGTNSGATLRLRGKGLRHSGSGKAGDQMIHLVIKLPKEADPDLEDFVRRRKGRVNFDPRESFATL